MKRTNIGGVTGDQVTGAQKDLAQKMSGDDPVISWEGLMVFQNLSREQHRLLERRENPFAVSADPVEQWTNLYRDCLGVKLDTKGLNFKVTHNEPMWPIVVAKGVKMRQIFAALGELFPCWKYTDGDLDKAVPTNDRVSDKTYIIWVRANIEADEEFADMSANDLKKKSHVGITLLERLLLELWHFTMTGKHLDEKNATLCAGSRCSLGSIPSVCWDDGRFGVSWDSPDDSGSDLRSRSVVSV